MVNPAKGTLTVVGRVSGSVIQQALASLSAQQLAAQASSTTLVAGQLAANHSALVLSPASQVFSLWNEHGVSTALAGAFHAQAKAQAGDVVESSSSSDKVSVRSLDIAANLFTHPSNVFLVAQDASGALPAIAQLNAAQARVHFALGNTGFLPAGAPEVVTLADRFAKLVQESKSNVFLVNQSTVSNVSSLVDTVASGALNNASGSVDATFGFNVPSQVGSLINSSSQKTSNDAAKKLASDLQSRARSLYPKLSLEGAFTSA
eukprot:TRINITY_DN42_c0_g1_i1.p1 TRINITY_DN42_c0_g1~~TRINITY_DN42_c0_g1_i1.p1  ORF type:complete len:262 (+),score=103.11 TRINITY_DN42_c0_g1_i1:592-1377(+)